MSTLANRPNNSALMSESDNDDDFDQNLSTNQQNESMIHKVKDVVTKFLHPSFLFSAAGAVEPARSKRKRTISTEEKTDDKQFETNGQPTANGHGSTSSSKEHRSNKNEDEAELTDDEISIPSQPKTVGIDQTNNSNSEQQTKRRRTANYQQILTPTTAPTTNGTHSHEKVSPLTNTTNNVNLSSSRRMHDYESKDTEENGRSSASNSTKTRFNIPATNRSFLSNYDPSQSPLFSVGNRRTNDTTMSPARTTTNLKSNNNEFSGNPLLVSSLSQRTPVSASTQLNQSISTLSSPNPNNSQRLMSNERQMLGINYASINSRRLPYIERLRRRTLQDCIRLNRTLDNEPLSISTIEEHTASSASPRRNPVKAPEKDCAVQCDISTTDNVPEPKRKSQRTFPPADIREEALSIPITEKTSSLNQMESSIQTHSSITIEPVKSIAADTNKPKVLANIAAFSWPKFARAQEEYAKKYPDRCRVESAPVLSTSTKSVSFAPSPTKMPIFDASPPRPTKPAAGPIWKCPSCTMEHPAQTASCSMCHGINPNYKRSSVIEPTPKTIESSKTVGVSVEKTTPIITPATISSVTTSQSVAITTSAPMFSMPSTNYQPISFTPVTMTATLVTPTSASVTTTAAPVTTPSISFTMTPKETSISNSPILSTAPISTTASPSLFGGPAMVSSTAPTATTSSSSLFGGPAMVSSTAPTATTASSSLFGAPPMVSSTAPTTTTPSSSLFGGPPMVSSTADPSSFSFGKITASAPTATSTTITSAVTSAPPISFNFGSSTTSFSSSSSSEKTPGFSFGATGTTVSSLANPTPFSTSPFSFGANTIASTASPITSTASNPMNTVGFSFGSGFQTSTAASSSSQTSTSSAPSLFGSISSGSVSGFNFQTTTASTSLTAATTTTSTPFTFGAGSPPRPFAPAVVSSTTNPSAPAFGSTGTFGIGAQPTTTFSAFGSSSSSGSFSFGSSNPSSSTPASTGSSSGFAFAAAPATSLTTLTGNSSIPTFGSTSSSFAFGPGSTSSTGSTPFQFGASSSTTTINPLPAQSNVDSNENNPFSISQDTSGIGKRQVIKAKRRAGKP